MASKDRNYQITTTFWSLFHSFLRQSGIDEANKARNACMWLTSEISILKNVLLGVEPTLLGIIHDHWITNQEAPSLDIIEDWLDSNPAPEVEDALNEYKGLKDGLRQHAQEDLGALLNRKAEEAKRYRLDELVTNVKVINSVGVEVRRGKVTENLKGPDDAIRYFIQKLDAGGVVTSDTKTHGSVQESTQFLKDYYESVKRQDSNKKKIKCGIDTIDEMISFKKGQLVGVLGFAGQRKTSFCRSWVYNAALMGFNTLHVSLEQKFEEELYYYAIIHSHHPKWGQQFSITTKSFEDGLMTKAEEDFLFNEVLPDLENLPGKIIIRQPTEGMTFEAIKTIAEVTDRITPIDIFLLDYLTICDTSGWGSDKEKHEANIKDAKRFALNFRGGEGILVLTPVQGNRDGYDEAAKNEGRWDMSGVYMYSEFDKSVDTMLYVFLDDDLMADGQIVMGTAKSRRSDVIKPHKNAINCAVGYVSNLRRHSKDDRIVDDIIEDL
jgi:hypothetical protein